MWQPIADVIRAAPPSPPMSDDRITMLLTAAGVIAAFGGIMLGLAALYMAYLAYRGKQDIEREARTIAENAAREEAGKVARQVAEEYLQKNDTVAKMFQTTTAEVEATPNSMTSNQPEQDGAVIVIEEVVPGEEDQGDGLE